MENLKYLKIYTNIMEKCECNGDENKYFDLISYDCEDKKPGVLYEKFKSVGITACWNVCDLNPSNPRCPKENIADVHLLKLFRIFEYLSANINLSNPYTKSLITVLQNESYDSELASLSSELVCSIGKAKILPTGSLNSELANIMNIFGSILYVITLGTEFESNETIEAMADLGCSAGKLNTYFQGIERKYDLQKIESNSELESLISLEQFNEELRNAIMRLYSIFIDKQEEFLTIEWVEGDNIGGNGSGSYNSKYKWFYIINFLITNKNLSMINGLNILFDEKIIAKYRELNEKATDMSDFLNKYLKYKNKYLNLKKNLKKINKNPI